MKTIKTVLRVYRFNMDVNDERNKYMDLRSNLESMGLRAFCSFVDYKSPAYRILHHDGDIDIEIDTSYLFNNQWNTLPITGVNGEDGVRVFDWFEATYSNKGIKNGYYLEQTDEMNSIRENTLVCGYCGKLVNREENGEKQFCDKCLDSEHLEEDELHLLRLLPVSYKGGRGALTDEEISEMLPKYRHAQIYGLTETGKKRVEASRNEVIKEAEVKINNAKEERDGYLWCMDRGIKTSNLIYYSGTGFCYGWRTPVSTRSDVLNKVKEAFNDFPYKLTFK